MGTNPQTVHEDASFLMTVKTMVPASKIYFFKQISNLASEIIGRTLVIVWTSWITPMYS